MSWMLTASGRHDPGAEVSAVRDVEHRLVAELKAVLSKPDYAAVSSWFRGIHVASSAVHQAEVGTAVPEAAVADQPAPQAEAAAPKSVSRGGRAAAAKTAGA